MTIPALPPLDRTSPTFKADLDTFFLTQLPDTVTALNSELTRIDGILPEGYVATSTTSLAIAGSGPATLTVQANKGFAPGQFVVISVTADPAVQMGGTVTAYDYTTGVLSVSVSQSAGTGTYAAWTIAISTASASPFSTGDIALTNRALTAPTWLPADGAIYNQASYAALYAEIGLLAQDPTRTAAFTSIAYNFQAASNEGYKDVYPLNNLLFCTGIAFSSNKFYTSADNGFTWATRTMPNTLSGKNFYVLYFLSKYWLVVDAATTVHESSDLSSWTSRGLQAAALAGGDKYRSIFVFKDMLVHMPATNSTTYYTSTDGINWTTRTLPATPGSGVYFGGGITHTANALVYYPPTAGMSSPWTTKPYYTSTDGINWTTRSIDFSPASWGLTGQGNFHFVGDPDGNQVFCLSGSTNNEQITNMFWSSDNGNTFVMVTAPRYSATNYNTTWQRILWAGGFIYQFAELDSGTFGIRYSMDGVNWLGPVSLGSIAYGQNGAEFSVFKGYVYVGTWRSPAHPSYYTYISRTALMPYDIATQFITPTVAGANGVTAYIKA